MPSTFEQTAVNLAEIGMKEEHCNFRSPCFFLFSNYRWPTGPVDIAKRLAKYQFTGLSYRVPFSFIFEKDNCSINDHYICFWRPSKEILHIKAISLLSVKTGLIHSLN